MQSGSQTEQPPAPDDGRTRRPMSADSGSSEIRSSLRTDSVGRGPRSCDGGGAVPVQADVSCLAGEQIRSNSYAEMASFSAEDFDDEHIGDYDRPVGAESGGDSRRDGALQTEKERSRKLRHLLFLRAADIFLFLVVVPLFSLAFCLMRFDLISFLLLVLVTASCFLFAVLAPTPSAAESESAEAAATRRESARPVASLAVTYCRPVTVLQYLVAVLMVADIVLQLVFLYAACPSSSSSSSSSSPSSSPSSSEACSLFGIRSVAGSSAGDVVRLIAMQVVILCAEICSLLLLKKVMAVALAVRSMAPSAAKMVSADGGDASASFEQLSSANNFQSRVYGVESWFRFCQDASAVIAVGACLLSVLLCQSLALLPFLLVVLLTAGRMSGLFSAESVLSVLRAVLPLGMGMGGLFLYGFICFGPTSALESSPAHLFLLFPPSSVFWPSAAGLCCIFTFAAASLVRVRLETISRMDLAQRSDRSGLSGVQSVPSTAPASDASSFDKPPTDSSRPVTSTPAATSLLARAAGWHVTVLSATGLATLLLLGVPLFHLSVQNILMLVAGCIMCCMSFQSSQRRASFFVLMVTVLVVWTVTFVLQSLRPRETLSNDPYRLQSLEYFVVVVCLGCGYAAYQRETQLGAQRHTPAGVQSEGQPGDFDFAVASSFFNAILLYPVAKDSMMHWMRRVVVLLMLHVDRVCLLAIYFCSLTSFTILNALFLVFFLVFFMNPGLARSHWRLLVVYASVVLVAFYIFSLVGLYVPSVSFTTGLIGLMSSSDAWLSPFLSAKWVFLIVVVAGVQIRIFRVVSDIRRDLLPSSLSLISHPFSQSILLLVTYSVLFVRSLLVAPNPTLLNLALCIFLLLAVFLHSCRDCFVPAVRTVFSLCLPFSAVVLFLRYLCQFQAMQPLFESVLPSGSAVSRERIGLVQYSSSDAQGLLLADVAVLIRLVASLRSLKTYRSALEQSPFVTLAAMAEPSRGLASTAAVVLRPVARFACIHARKALLWACISAAMVEITAFSMLYALISIAIIFVLAFGVRMSLSPAAMSYAFLVLVFKYFAAVSSFPQDSGSGIWLWLGASGRVAFGSSGIGRSALVFFVACFCKRTVAWQAPNMPDLPVRTIFKPSYEPSTTASDSIKRFVDNAFFSLHDEITGILLAVIAARLASLVSFVYLVCLCLLFGFSSRTRRVGWLAALSFLSWILIVQYWLTIGIPRKSDPPNTGYAHPGNSDAQQWLDYLDLNPIDPMTYALEFVALMFLAMSIRCHLQREASSSTKRYGIGTRDEEMPISPQSARVREEEFSQQSGASFPRRGSRTVAVFRRSILTNRLEVVLFWLVTVSHYMSCLLVLLPALSSTPCLFTLAYLLLSLVLLYEDKSVIFPKSPKRVLWGLLGRYSLLVVLWKVLYKAPIEAMHRTDWGQSIFGFGEASNVLSWSALGGAGVDVFVFSVFLLQQRVFACDYFADFLMDIRGARHDSTHFRLFAALVRHVRNLRRLTRQELLKKMRREQLQSIRTSRGGGSILVSTNTQEQQQQQQREQQGQYPEGSAGDAGTAEELHGLGLQPGEISMASLERNIDEEESGAVSAQEVRITAPSSTTSNAPSASAGGAAVSAIQGVHEEERRFAPAHGIDAQPDSRKSLGGKMRQHVRRWVEAGCVRCLLFADCNPYFSFHDDLHGQLATFVSVGCFPDLGSVPALRLLLFSVFGAVCSHFHHLVFVLLAVSFLAYGSLISAVFFASALCYGLLKTPFPPRGYFKALLIAETVWIVVKYIFQMTIFCICHAPAGDLLWFYSACANRSGSYCSQSPTVQQTGVLWGSFLGFTPYPEPDPVSSSLFGFLAFDLMVALVIIYYRSLQWRKAQWTDPLLEVDDCLAAAAAVSHKLPIVDDLRRKLEEFVADFLLFRKEVVDAQRLEEARKQQKKEEERMRRQEKRRLDARQAAQGSSRNPAVSLPSFLDDVSVMKLLLLKLLPAALLRRIYAEDQRDAVGEEHSSDAGNGGASDSLSKLQTDADRLESRKTLLKAAAGRDFYSFCVFWELVCLFLLFFLYYQLFPSEVDYSSSSNQSVFSSLSSSQVSGIFVVALLVQTGFIIADRVFYIKRPRVAKKIFLLGIAVPLYVFVMPFWLSYDVSSPTLLGRSSLSDPNIYPLGSFNPFSANQALLFFIMLKCLYLHASGTQVGIGFPRLFVRKLNFSYIAYVLFIITRSIPFLFELKSLIDWTTTKTALPLYDWMKNEDVFSDLYKRKCDVEYYRGMKRKVGDRQPLSSKLFSGVLLLGFLLLVLFLPLIYYSSLNPTLASNSVSAISVRVGIVGHDPLYSTSQLAGSQGLSVSDVRGLVADYSGLHSFQLATLTVQELFTLPFSDSLWEISPPSRNSLTGALLDMSIEVQMQTLYSFTRFGPVGNRLVSGQSLLVLTQVQRLQLASMVSSNASSSGAVDLSGLYTPFVRLWPYLDPQPVDTGEAQVSCVMAKSGTFGSPQNPEYWSINCSLPNIEPTATSVSGPFFVTASDDVPKDSSLLSSYSILAFYLTFVVAVGRFIRLSFSDLAQKIIVEDLPEPQELVNLVLMIFEARDQKDLELEEELYTELINIYRSPEMLVKITEVGSRIKVKRD